MSAATEINAEQDLAVSAQRLLDAMSSIRRVLRRNQDRPAALSTLTGAELELIRLVQRRPGLSVAQAADEPPGGTEHGQHPCEPAGRGGHLG